MKKIITSLCLSFMFVVAAFSSSKANVYYVVSGDSFTLTPAVASLFQYQWLLDPGANQVSTVLNTATGGVYSKVFGDSTTLGVETHKLTFGVLAAIDGCLSEVVEHTIVVLPRVTISLTSPKENFCLGLPVSTELTANITAVTGLGTVGVSLSPLAWTKDGAVITGQSAATLAVTTSGSYKALVSYILPTTGIFTPTAMKLGEAIKAKALVINNTLPLPALPTISLN